MNFRTKSLIIAFFCLMLVLTACDNESNVANNVDKSNNTDQSTQVKPDEPDKQQVPPVSLPEPIEETPPIEEKPIKPIETDIKEETPDNLGDKEAVEVVANPEAVEVLVNKKFSLPKDYEPQDLTEPNVPFIFKEKNAKRLMRKEAAEALEKLFAGAKEDGNQLAGVSGYRSYATQKSLFERYVKRDGIKEASRYSARPGHSEHSTGLAMDVSGIDAKCAATDCFGKTDEAKWLGENVYEYGFIIRYPEGKEEITGYKYEPWHLRYVGIEMALIIQEKGITLEEYYESELSQPVAQPTDV